MEKKVKDLVQGDIIIVKETKKFREVAKLEILEITKSSIYYEYKDIEDYRKRILLEDFDIEFQVIELLYNKDIKENIDSIDSDYWDKRLKEILNQKIKKNPYKTSGINPLRQVYPDWTVRDYFRWNDKTDITITYR